MNYSTIYTLIIVNVSIFIFTWAEIAADSRIVAAKEVDYNMELFMQNMESVKVSM